MNREQMLAKISNLNDEQLRILNEIMDGDGLFYITQERAFAPGISGEWPNIIPHPTSKHGRLVKRKIV